MRPHEKLEAWSKSVELVTDVHKRTVHLPRGRFKTIYHLPFTIYPGS